VGEGELNYKAFLAFRPVLTGDIGQNPVEQFLQISDGHASHATREPRDAIAQILDRLQSNIRIVQEKLFKILLRKSAKECVLHTPGDPTLLEILQSPLQYKIFSGILKIRSVRTT